jgi:hypothetical protein
MKAHAHNRDINDTPSRENWPSGCSRTSERIREAKDALLETTRAALDADERMLRLALNEAEALAWQTRYPDLVFMDLAAEKVQEVASWNRHQQILRGFEATVVLTA